MTRADYLVTIRNMGLSAKRVEGEYRINYIDGKEATAYYTDNAEDAIGTATLMKGNQSC